MSFPKFSQRSFFLLFFALLLMCWISLAQDNVKRGQPPRTNARSEHLTCSPCHLWFGGVPVGQTQRRSAKLINRGSTKITISRISRAASEFSLNNLPLPLTLGAGETVKFNVSFTPPADRQVDSTFKLISSAANRPLFFDVHGHGKRRDILGASPSSISFGDVQPGKSVRRSETLTNSGTSSVTVSRVKAAGAGFSVSGLRVPLTLTPGQSFTFGAVFTPTTGVASGSISVVSTASNPLLTISLSGEGTASGQLAESPNRLNFNNVTVGTSKSLPVTLRATGSSVTISSAITNNSEFTLSGVTFPLTLAAGKSASVNLNFAAQSSGASSGAISFVSNASNSPTAETVTGSGNATSGHSVNLSWHRSNSRVIGYNVYRGAVSGGPYVQINSAIDPNTAYTDSTVLADSTYYYVLTSVARSGTESGFSNQVKVAIP